MKKIAILGSTGSIGTQTLEIVRKEDDLQVAALAAGMNVDLMEKQVREFKPALAAMWTQDAAQDLRERLSDLPVRVACGMDGLLEVAVCEAADVLVTAIVGMIGIRPTIAVRHRRSHKPCLCWRRLLLALDCDFHRPFLVHADVDMSILPVDSEHSAIFQSMHGENRNRVSKILLTASGGPFRGKTRQELAAMTVEDALKHPNWSMGKKVTIDSASLVNKGLEVMEAKWLFDVELDQIQVVVHPQSILHSAVEYVDGGIMAQLGVPDMKLPIQYALFYPDRRPMDSGRVDFFKLGQLTFEKPDTETFRGLALAYRAAEAGGTLPTVFNAANEKAVALFLQKKITFLQIPELIESSMEQHKVIADPTVEQILETEASTYEYIKEKFGE